MRDIRKQLSYLWALITANIKSYAPEKKRLFIMSLFMVIQNTIFFALWIVFFDNVSDVKGWRLAEIAQMFGIGSSGIGISLFFANGARTIAYRIQEGTLDGFITKPREVLPVLMTSSSSPASLGDVFYGPFMWAMWGDLSWSNAPLLLALTLIAAALFTAFVIAIFSVSFWLKGNARFPEQLFEMMIIFTTNVVHGQSFKIKLLTFTVIPAAFINFVPILLLKDFSWLLFASLVAVTIVHCWLAVKIFNAGLRRYVNSQS